MYERLPFPDIDINESYTTFLVEVIKVAKATIPRGYRNTYIPGWDGTCQQLSNAHAEAVTVNDKQSTAESLLNHLNNKRKKSWTEATESIDMKHSSRKACSTLNKLTSRKKISTTPNSVSANSVASCLLSNGKYTNLYKLFTYSVNQKLKEAWNAPAVDQDLTSEFTIEELVAAMRTFKPGKSPEPDNIHPEFILHLHDSCLKWLTNLFSTCMEHKKMPKSWKIAKIIAVLKPNKLADLPKSYRSISLLSVTYKLLERLIYNRILPIVESFLPEEQAGFIPNRGTLDQVALFD